MQRTLEKLDPSGRARHYDVVSSSGGKIIKVEALTDRLERAAATKCKPPPLKNMRPIS